MRRRERLLQEPQCTRLSTLKDQPTVPPTSLLITHSQPTSMANVSCSSLLKRKRADSAERQKGVENEGRGDTEASFFQMKTLEEGLDRLSRTIASVPLPKQFEQLPKRLNQLTGGLFPERSEEETGAIKTLSKGGKGNTLSKLGKIILSRALKKQFKRKVPTFVSPLRASRPMAVTDFETTRAQCLEMRVLFEVRQPLGWKMLQDPDFPAENSSISFSRAPPRRVIWKRPFVRISQ